MVVIWPLWDCNRNSLLPRYGDGLRLDLLIDLSGLNIGPCKLGVLVPRRLNSDYRDDTLLTSPKYGDLLRGAMERSEGARW